MPLRAGAASPAATARGRASSTRCTSTLPGSSANIMWAEFSNQTKRFLGADSRSNQRFTGSEGVVKS